MSNHKFSIFQNLSLITHLGILMILPIFGGVFLGNWIDKKLQTGNVFLLIFVIIGVASGFLNVYKVVMKDIKKKSK